MGTLLQQAEGRVVQALWWAGCLGMVGGSMKSGADDDGRWEGYVCMCMTGVAGSIEGVEIEGVLQTLGAVEVLRLLRCFLTPPLSR